MPDFIYARVSKKTNKKEHGRQEVLMQVVALKDDYPNAEIWQEKGSAYKGRLPVLEKLLAKLKRDDRLIIFSLDRLGRRLIALAQLFEDLNKRGIILISRRESIDFSTITGKMVGHILGSVAQVESEIRAERISLGLQTLMASKEYRKDVANGDRLPIGRQKGAKPHLQLIKGAKRDSRTKRIEGFYEQVIDLHKEGYSFRKIQRFMSKNSKTSVSISTIHKYVKEWRETGEIPVALVEPIDPDARNPQTDPRMGDKRTRKPKNG